MALPLVAFAPSVDLAPTPYAFPKLKRFPAMPLSQTNPVTNEGVALGRHLFYDPILSRDSSISCGSCHRQEAAFSDGPQVLSKGIREQKQKRNTPPLFNMAWYSRLFWDGRAASIEEQVFQPVAAHDEMDLPWSEAEIRLQRSAFYQPMFRAAFGDDGVTKERIAQAIGQFERTLLSYRSKFDRAINFKGYLNAEEYAGFVLMNDMTKGDCLHCHTTDADPLGTTGAFSNNGLDPVYDANGYKDAGRGAITKNLAQNGQFRIPSLRNIALTAPYMHDGRFASLKEVLDFYSEGVHQGANVDSKMQFAKKGGVHLTEQEKEQIMAFLQTLTDSAFVNDPAFSNPFE